MGEAVGDFEGERVAIVGDWVGSLVGVLVGDFVGEAVGRVGESEGE